MRTAVQLYTLRNLTESFTSTATRVADAGFDRVEFAGLEASPAEIVSALEETDLSVAGAHVSIADLEERFEPLVERYEQIGCDRFVVPSYDVEAFESREGVEEAADRLSALAGRLADCGNELHYHNHTFEFADLGGETGFDRLIAETNDSVGIELDTGLVRHAGEDPVDLLDRYGDRVSLLHLTDTRPDSDGGLHADYGEGIVDLDACVEAGVRNDVDCVVAEHGTTEHPAETLVHAGETIGRLLAE